MEQINDNKQSLKGPGCLRNGKRYSYSKQGPPTKRRCTSQIYPHPDHPAYKPHSNGIFTNTIPEIWAVICSNLSKNDCKHLAQVNRRIRQTMHSQIFHTGLLEFQTISQSYQEKLPYCETWLLRSIAMKSIQDMEEGVEVVEGVEDVEGVEGVEGVADVEGVNLHILSKKRAEQIRAILPNHYHLSESLVARLSDISDPIISNNKLDVSSLIKNHLSQEQFRAIESYFKEQGIQLVWQTDLNSPAMMPYFSNPVISYFAQNELLKCHPPIDLLGSYGPDGQIISMLNTHMPGIHEYCSLGYNGKLHVFLNKKTNYLIVSNINADGSRSLSCQTSAPHKINNQIHGNTINAIQFKVAISPNNKWIMIYLAPPHENLLYLYEYHQDQTQPNYLELKAIHIENLGTEKKIRQIQFTQDSKILLISVVDVYGDNKLLMISTTSFNDKTDTKKDETDRMLSNYRLLTVGYDYILTRQKVASLISPTKELDLQKWDIKSIQSGNPSTQYTIQMPALSIEVSVIWAHHFTYEKIVLTDDFLFVTRQNLFSLNSVDTMIKSTEVLVFKNEKYDGWQYKYSYITDYGDNCHLSDTGQTIISYPSESTYEPMNISIHVFNRDKVVYDPVNISLPSSCHFANTIISNLDETVFIISGGQHKLDDKSFAFTLIQNPDSTWRAVNNEGELPLFQNIRHHDKSTQNGLMRTAFVFLAKTPDSLRRNSFDFLYKEIKLVTAF